MIPQVAATQQVTINNLPTAGMTTLTSIVIADVTYVYQPLFSGFFLGSVTLNRTAFLPPRVGSATQYVQYDLANSTTDTSLCPGFLVKAPSGSNPNTAPPVWRRYLRDRSAAVALTFAISVLPVTLLIGVAIDLGFVTQSKSQLNAAADAAALAAATTAANGFTAGLPNYIALGQTAGSQWFDSQGKTTLNTSTPTATVGVPHAGRSVFFSTVTYQATVPTYFGGIVGYPTISVSWSIERYYYDKCLRVSNFPAGQLFVDVDRGNTRPA